MTIVDDLFESQAEKKAYPYLKKLEPFLNDKLVVQHIIKSYDLKDWVLEKIENGEWSEADAEDYSIETQIDVYYSYEKYRLDFAFLDKLIGIEIDGEQWHDFEKDYQRDKYLTKKGWRIIRIKAKDVFSGRIKYILDQEFKIGQRNLEDYSQ